MVAVATTPGSNVSAADITEWGDETAPAAYKHPRAVVFVDELPKGPSGKIRCAIEREPP